MVRAGLFDKIDIAFHWHPGSGNGVAFTNALTYWSAKFRFYGVASHASVSSEKGRSALDGVKAINNIANKMELPVAFIENTNQNKYLIK